MTHTNMTNGLEMRWFPVADATGRTHMEARWVLVGETAEHSMATPQAA